MNAVKMAAIVLIAAGVLGLVYGRFSYTKDTHDAKDPDQYFDDVIRLTR